jgi:3-oxoacyl-ACP reductase-like protein
MGILSNIFHKIFPGSKPDAAQPATAPAPAPAAAAAPAAPQPAAATPVTPLVDVEAILTTMQQQNSQPLNWRTSIVDLLKLLNLDSSLASRKELADELHYTGDKNDSASMNIWLHKQVMIKLSENGGKVPAELKD